MNFSNLAIPLNFRLFNTLFKCPKNIYTRAHQMIIKFLCVIQAPLCPDKSRSWVRIKPASQCQLPVLVSILPVLEELASMPCWCLLEHVSFAAPVTKWSCISREPPWLCTLLSTSHIQQLLLMLFSKVLLFVVVALHSLSWSKKELNEHLLEFAGTETLLLDMTFILECTRLKEWLH